MDSVWSLVFTWFDIDLLDVSQDFDWDIFTHEFNSF